ncbi:MAG: ribokinase [Mogibacterium sp.]|nr:ribokinase [Oscillospiraceae bacterium]MBR3126234.1 ribokinase [Mogibacterium sp.]
MKVINFGSLNVDHVYRVPHAVAEGETLACGSLQKLMGGKGLNQSIAIAKAGAKVIHGGLIGDEGQFLVDFLSESGVDVSKIGHTDEPQGHAVIQVNDNGNNCIIVFGGSNQCVTKEYIDDLLSETEEGDIVVLENEVSNIDYIMARAHEKKCPVVFNASPIDDKVVALDYSNVDWLIINEIEGAAIAKTDSIDDIIPEITKKYPEISVVLTLGEEGSICYSKGQVYRQKAYKADVVDTTAAGDTFLGYFVAGLINGDDMQTILKTASAASSIAVSIMGAAASVPTVDKVKEYLKNIGE